MAAGRPARRGHHRHQHGRPRHRHRARRQPRRRELAGAAASADEAARAARCARPGSSATTRCSPPAACTSSAPSATSRGASTISCAAARAARAIPGSSRFYLSMEDNLMRIFGDPTRTKRLLMIAGMKDGEVDRERHAHAPDREGAAQRRVAQLRHPQAAAAVRRRRQRSAQGHLSAAHRDLMGAEDVAERRSRAMREDVVAQLVDQSMPQGVAGGHGTCPGSRRRWSAISARRCRSKTG